MRTPPGVSAADYGRALQEFTRIVGAANVYASDADLDLYRDDYSILWGEPDERIASGAVAPASVAEVQAVVRIANRYHIPLYPISTGRNLGYGGSAPAYSGSVVLDLKRMNKVVEINEEQRYCIVEPGVSFFDLYAELRRRNVKLIASMPAPGWGSPIGNALDHGRGSPAGDNFRNSSGMEVVLGNGDLVRTGMAALPGGKTWASYPNGVGPALDGLFSQSNFGVVTKMGFNLFPWPETTRRLLITTRNYEDVDGMIAACTELQTQGVGGGSGVFSPLHDRKSAAFVELASRKGGASSAQYNQLARDENVDLFMCSLSFAGPDKLTAVQLEIAQERVAALVPGAKSVATPVVHAPDDPEHMSEAQGDAIGRPSLQRFWEDTAQYDWDGHLWFSPMLPQTGAEFRKIQQVMGDFCRQEGIFWGLPPALLYNTTRTGAASTAYCIVKNFNVSKTDKAQNRKTLEVLKKLIRVAADNGWSEYRAAPALQQALMDTLSFNEHAFMRLCTTIKDAVDPNGVLSAGRYGIWPKHLRKST